jgi:TM2 domain-containing membrane protein YozV
LSAGRKGLAVIEGFVVRGVREDHACVEWEHRVVLRFEKELAMTYPAPMSEAGGKKLAAGLCAIFIGSFGIHKFILGYTTAGLIMLLATVLTCGIAGMVMHVISIVEGVIYLTKSDAEFYETYMVRQKEWF